MLEEIKYANIRIGQKASIERTITKKDIDDFTRISGDANPFHVDKKYAEKSIFKGIIAHGMFTASLISAVLGTKLPGSGYVYLKQDLKFVLPVKPNDIITAEVEVIGKRDEKKHVELKTTCFNQNKELVLEGKALTKYILFD
ncbi:MAG: MaoC family dehydratase [archaeon]|nr:MaoC family dehydratase [archaeon]